MKIKTLLGAIVLTGSSLLAVTAQAAVVATPEQAVKSYFNAVDKGDEAGFNDLMQFPDVLAQLPAEQSQKIRHDMFQQMQASLKSEGGLKALEVSNAQKGADASHMTVHIKGSTRNGETHEADVPVVKVGKGWKVGQ
ncbi:MULTISPECIES: DUF4878 domain-containing protein [unclassified Zymobacter]|uniref:DUF4878 domain-containing protein n=1 Tax=unclassified Zymobacter TaxID=3048685 RepID=UPI0039C3D33F